MNKIDQILDTIKTLLISFHFKTVEINGEINYVFGNTYCIPHYIRQIGFFMEYAHSFEDAQKNWHEDGDGFPLEMGEKEILAGLEKEIKQSINNRSTGSNEAGL